MATTNKLLEEREAVYGEAWRTTGTILSLVNIERLQDSGLLFNWVMIMNKLVRLLETPDHLDSWQDISGYATLVSNSLESQESAAPTGAQRGPESDLIPYNLR